MASHQMSKTTADGWRVPEPVGDRGDDALLGAALTIASADYSAAETFLAATSTSCVAVFTYVLLGLSGHPPESRRRRHTVARVTERQPQATTSG